MEKNQIALLGFLIAVFLILSGCTLMKQGKEIDFSISSSNSPVLEEKKKEESREHGMGAMSYGEIEDICGKRVDYSTNVSRVNGSKTVKEAFGEYVEYMKQNNIKDRNLAVDWEFMGTRPAGFYQGKFYWLVDFHYFTEEDREQGGNAQFYISDDGEITRLLGCI